MAWPETSSDPVGRLVHWARKRRAIKRFLRRLPRPLFEEFGRDPYTPGQIETTIRRLRLAPPAYWPYALAIFCDADQLKLLRAQRNGDDDYERLRGEVGDAFFGGDAGFTANDVSRDAGQHHGGGQSFGEGDGGHHGGGDAGGGHH